MRVRLGKADLAEGEMRGYRLPGDRHVLLARVEGRYSALDDVCNHGGCLLSRGELRGFEVACPCHAMTFDVRTGTLTSLPRLCDDQPAHGVELRDGEAWVELGAPAGSEEHHGP